jgi:hypothetical protein
MRHENTGLLVAPLDVDAFCTAIVELLEDHGLSIGYYLRKARWKPCRPSGLEVLHFELELKAQISRRPNAFSRR